ncbi:hypothetical protein B0J18DRAFT_441587 [Chaetomium sp. MPI-SDFR-AT-0129]|nr:hypothetical protein B0J18DRAFT_441587 [Chaetomium sp. MPI-SDFR-AT-0129]
MASQPKITLYWLNESRAQRIAWLLEELHLSYDVQIFHRDANMQAPPELQKIHPLGKSPVIGITPSSSSSTNSSQPKEKKELILAESAVIAQYLTEHFGKQTSLLPRQYREGEEGQVGGETEEWLRYQYYLHYAEGSLMPPILVGIILDILKGPKIPFFIRPITSSIVSKLYAAFLLPEILRHLAFLESQLETAPQGGPYLCGAQLTTADILMGFPIREAKNAFAGLEVGDGKGTVGERFPRLWKYLDLLEAEEGYKKAGVKIAELEKRAKGESK